MAAKRSKHRRKFDCPVEATLDVIGGKWKVVILYWLGSSALRFSDLKRQIKGVSDRMLVQQLRELEDHGIIHREVIPETPPRVLYSLTNYGRTLEPITDLMFAWGEIHIQQQATFDETR